ncbi:MAG: nucleotidyltransferase [Bacillota bacterium]
MANVHKHFLAFHDTIKLDDENKTLRDKRDIILGKLKKNMSQDAKGYDTFNQGSYAMSTGVIPVNGDYDIDVGIKFKMSKDDAEPLTAKDWVFKALDGHTKSVKIKNPCVTVAYQLDGEPAYHVDLAVYAAENADGKLYLAKGKPESKPENKKWEASSPQELLDKIREHFSNLDDRAQFRRVIRYLKRWKDIKFTDGGNSKPTGIALTCAAYHWLSPNKTLVDVIANKYEYNDLKCVIEFVSSIISKFYLVWDQDSGRYMYRIKVQLPVDPYSDLMEKMTNKHMEKFKEKLEKLLKVLKEAENEVDPVEACKKLKEEFGEDFPVPPPEETAKSRSVAITTTSSSA